MSASEKLKELDGEATSRPWETGRPSERHVSSWIGQERFFHLCRSEDDAALIAALRNALPQIVAVIAAAEELPEFFTTPDGRTHSFIPLLDVLDEALK